MNGTGTATVTDEEIRNTIVEDDWLECLKTTDNSCTIQVAGHDLTFRDIIFNAAVENSIGFENDGNTTGTIPPDVGKRNEFLNITARSTTAIVPRVYFQNDTEDNVVANWLAWGGSMGGSSIVVTNDGPYVGTHTNLTAANNVKGTGASPFAGGTTSTTWASWALDGTSDDDPFDNEGALKYGAIADARNDLRKNTTPAVGAFDADTDGDGIADGSDNCVTTSNPRAAAGFIGSNSWATLTGGQRDDDGDGYGNRCDWNFAGNYPGGGGWVCNVFDMAASPSHPSMSADNCGYCNVSLPCAVLDLDEDLSVENNWPEDDYNAVPQGSDVASGPRCETCPLTCEEGAGGNCP